LFNYFKLFRFLVNIKGEVKNSCLELLPIIGQQTEVIEAGFRSLLRALRHFYDEKIATLPEDQLRNNRRQYKDEVIRSALARED
jgi:hypothetical protein